MYIKLFNEDKKVIKLIKISNIIFNKLYNEFLVKQILISYFNNIRKGQRKQKNRSSVKHSTKKLFRQKGTGKARAGMSSSPIRRGGGRAFPNLPFENFNCKINKKMYKKSLSIIFSQLIRENRFYLIDKFYMDNHKTKFFLKKILKFNLGFSILLILKNIDNNIYLSSRNIKSIFIMKCNKINLIKLFNYKLILCSYDSFLEIENYLNK